MAYLAASGSCVVRNLNKNNCCIVCGKEVKNVEDTLGDKLVEFVGLKMSLLNFNICFLGRVGDYDRGIIRLLSILQRGLRLLIYFRYICI